MKRPWNEGGDLGVKLILDDVEAQVNLFRTTIDNHLHRLVISAAERGYSGEEIAAFLEIPVENVDNFLTYSPDVFEPN
ncbi:hypothetical protein MOC16_gp342 [Klebsiella phage vB_KpM_FBKp24]|uniref:Uncharacterized protein n=1 Tax=Klebsiella phage vB_KpM_FBKp24 TaxID=2801834 RepID=A0A7U0GBX3_9CAUD|nr:hypothetical protein MOC16_gp342 [Klebsiella phage vB_KpM_FBKp24]QQV92332.1 hypothetical protein vBKpMFBKp24_071 [Klebsiella phage vB_KpM_FBKp24]